MTVDRGLLATLTDKPGKGDELGAFLKQGHELAAQEEGTVSWYAFRLDVARTSGRSLRHHPIDVLAVN
jgi:hypothetical protein